MKTERIFPFLIWVIYLVILTSEISEPIAKWDNLPEEVVFPNTNGYIKEYWDNVTICLPLNKISVEGGEDTQRF